MFTVPRSYEVVGTEAFPDYFQYNELFEQVGLDWESNPTAELSPRAAKATIASNNHKEAERRRRKRINAHIATLRSILPNTVKTDKASLLSEAVRRVKDLNDATALHNVDESFRLMIPSETNDLQLEANSGLIKATLSCEDQADMIPDLVHAVKSAEAKVVRAEMSTVGSRTKMVLWVEPLSNLDNVALGTLRKALKIVVDKVGSGSGSGSGLDSGSEFLGNKRTRHYQ